MSPTGQNQVQYLESKMILQVVMNDFCFSSNTGSTYMFSALPVSFSHHEGGFCQLGMGFVHCTQLSLSALGEKYDTDCSPPF